jgi:hypothetical protein
MCLLEAVFRLEERHWICRDQLMEVTPEAPGFTRFEWQIANILRRELSDELQAFRASR